MFKSLSILALLLVASPTLAQNISGNVIPPNTTSTLPLPQVTTNALLAGASTLFYPSGVWRLGVTVAGDASPLLFLPSSTTCTFNAGAGDVGSQVPSIDGKCWLASYSAGTTADLREWGLSTAASNNAPFIDRAMSWCATVGGCHLVAPAGVFNVTSTFDCHNASGMSLEGAGNDTVILRTANYGHTMTCGSTAFTQNIHVKNIWFNQFIGNDPTTSFINPTTGFGSGYDALGSAHFKYVNVNNFTFDHVTAWNMNFNFMIIDSISGTWTNPLLFGFWDGTHNQTKANFYFDGADSEYPNGHSQSMTIHDMLTGGPLTFAPQTFGSGWTAHTIASYRTSKGAYDDILVKSIEGLFIDGGGAAVGSNFANLEIRPQGVAGKPILQVHSNGYWFDNAHRANVVIDNADGGVTCSNPNMVANGVEFNGGMFNGELEAINAIYVANNTCNSVIGLHISNMEVAAYIGTPYYLGGVGGGALNGGTIRAYNVFGINFGDIANASAAWIFGGTTNFTVSNLGVGGGTVYEGPGDAVGVALLYAGGTGWTPSGSGTLTWAGPDCSTNPVLNFTTNGAGLMFISGVANAGHCQTWPPITAATWTVAGVAGGVAPQVALGPPYINGDQGQFGITLSGGLINVKRYNINNNGYFQTFISQQLSCVMGAGSPTNITATDNRHAIITTNAASGAVTSGSCAFNGPLSNFANVVVKASDAAAPGNIPVIAAVTRSYPSGFDFVTSASIGGGGRITFTMDGMD